MSDEHTTGESGSELDLDADLLTALVARHVARGEPALAEDDACFMNFVARQSRLRPARATDWSPERVRRVRDRVLQRALGLTLGVRTERGMSRARNVAPVPFGQALDEAAHSFCAPWPALAVAAGDGRELWDEECDRWLELPVGTPPGRYVALTVTGDSMLPLLHAGDTILVKLAAELKRDTVVVARRADDGYVVKRVGAVRGRRVELLSLNPEYPPVSIPNDGRALLGMVVMRWCAHDALSITAPRAD